MHHFYLAFFVDADQWTTGRQRILQRTHSWSSNDSVAFLIIPRREPERRDARGIVRAEPSHPFIGKCNLIVRTLNQRGGYRIEDGMGSCGRTAEDGDAT